MKRNEKLLSLLLAAVLLLGMLAGCGASAVEEPADESPSAEVSSEALDSAAPVESEDTSAEPAEQAEAQTAASDTQTPAITYPLEGDDLELTYWMPFKSPYDTILFQKI